MGVKFLYRTSVGRTLLKIMQKAGLFRVIARYLQTKASRIWIPGYIQKNQIDMQLFKEQTYDSFADFFARRRNGICIAVNPHALISPCDGLLSVYPIVQGMNIPMKGSSYRMQDLIPDKGAAELFRDGLCLVFRLRASDYHYFCAFDDCVVQETHYIPGLLHSVQPIACESVPVYRLNRRWWSVVKSVTFGTVIQIEVGAMLVGEVRFQTGIGGKFQRGDEMGNFELAGSTVILLLNEEVRRQLEFLFPFQKAIGGKTEVPVRMGEGIGVLQSETH